MCIGSLLAEVRETYAGTLHTKLHFLVAYIKEVTKFPCQRTFGWAELGVFGKSVKRRLNVASGRNDRWEISQPVSDRCPKRNSPRNFSIRGDTAFTGGVIENGVGDRGRLIDQFALSSPRFHRRRNFRLPSCEKSSWGQRWVIWKIDATDVTRIFGRGIDDGPRRMHLSTTRDVFNRFCYGIFAFTLSQPPFTESFLSMVMD